MHFISTISLYFLLFINYSLQEGQNPFEVREHSLTRPYQSVFSTSNAYWSLTGNTIVTDRYIRLTPDSQSKFGGLWSSIPVAYSDWELHVQFKVHGEGKTFFGDGFAIWYVKEPKLSGPVFGYADQFNGLAIIMDTYGNKVDDYTRRFPYIMGIVNNGSLHYSNDVDGANISIAGCESSFRGRDTDTLVAIRYQNDRLTVSTDIDGLNKWSECFSVNNIHLPSHYYFGFSAATGQLSDNHDIISVRAYQLDVTDERRQQDRRDIVPSAPTLSVEDEDTNASKSKSWSALKIFFIVAGLIVLCVIGIGAYFYFKQRRYYKSRLY